MTSFKKLLGCLESIKRTKVKTLKEMYLNYKVYHWMRLSGLMISGCKWPLKSLKIRMIDKRHKQRKVSLKKVKQQR